MLRFNKVNILWLRSEKFASLILAYIAAKAGVPKYRRKFLNSEAFQLAPYLEYDLDVYLLQLLA